MNFQLDAMQRLLLWRLAVTEDGEFLKDINTSLSAAKRKALVREGFIEEGKRKHPKSGRSAAFLTLEDKGWNWCQMHLTDELNTRSTQTTPILERLLKLLAAYFDGQEQTKSFGQFVLQARQGRTADVPLQRDASPQEAVPETEPQRPLAEAIRAACLQLAGGRRNVRVRIADLRQTLGHTVPRREVDETLLAMERDGELSLYRFEDPREIGHADREAVLRTPSGNERHIVYFEGK